MFILWNTAANFSINWFLVFYQQTPETERTEFSKQRLWVTSWQSVRWGNKTCFSLLGGRQMHNLIWVKARLKVGFSFLMMPVMRCRKPCPGIAIISYNQGFWLGLPSRLCSVAQTSGSIKDTVYTLCYRSDGMVQLVLSGLKTVSGSCK